MIRLSRLETAILSPHLRIHFDQQLATLQEQVLVLTLSQRVSTPGRQTALEFRTPQVSHTFSTEKDNTAFNVALSHMLEDSRAIAADTYLIQVAHELERIGDRATNIAERLIYVMTGELTDLNT